MADEYDFATKSLTEAVGALEELAAPATGDKLLIWDASAGVMKWIDAEYYAAA